MKKTAIYNVENTESYVPPRVEIVTVEVEKGYGISYENGGRW